MWLHSQRSRNIWTGVMKPYSLPRAQTRVPIKKIVNGITSAEDEAIKPKVTIPFVKACPDEPRIAKAVMFVPKSEKRKTNGPIERPARKKSSASFLLAAFLNAKMPI